MGEEALYRGWELQKHTVLHTQTMHTMNIKIDGDSLKLQTAKHSQRTG